MTLPISVKRQLRDFTKLLVAIVVSLQFAVLGAQAAYDVENLDRGVVAVSQGNSVFVSWPIFISTPYSHKVLMK